MANNSIIAPNEFLPDENDKMFSSQRVQEQVFRLNQLAKLGGGEDWEGYQKKEEETGIPAIYHAFSKERRNVNEVHVPPGAVNEDNAELLESMPPADAAQIGFDKVTLDALAEYGRRRKFYGQMLDAQVEQMSAGEQWQSFGSGKFATAGMDAPEDITPENYGDNLSKMARAIREADGVDEVEARLRAERLMQVAGHKRTPEEQTCLDGAYARIQNGESIDTILAEDAFNKSPYLSRMLQLYDNTLRRTAMMTQAVIGEVYGGEQWEKFSDKEKGYALDALRQSFPGLPWLHDVSPAMIGEKTLAGGGLQWENLANIMGAVTIGKAIIESFNPFSDGNPLYMGGGALKTNRYYYNRMIDAARPSSLAFDIGQGAIDSLAFMVNIGFGGFAAGTEKLLETITWRTALPTLGKVFGINALHALKGGKYGAYAINALVQGIGENMTAAEANPVVVYDGSTGMKVELNDGDADSMFNNIVLAFGRNYLAQAISVGTEGVGGVIDGLVTLPKGAKKFLLQKILGNLSPKVMARTQDMLGRFGINGMTGEFFEELLEDYLQPAKDRMLELVGADALSTHQTPQSWASPGRWALTTAGVLYAMRAPFSAVSTATVISDYARGKIAFEQVLNEAGVGEGSKPTDKDQSAVSGHAQRAMHVVNGRVHFVPSVGVEAVYAKHPDVAEKIRPIIHDDGTGTMAVNSFEAGEMMRNNPETVNAMREVLECTTSVKNLSVEDARAALQVYGDRVQFVSDVAGAVKLGIEAMPDSSRRRRISGGNSYAIAQMVACFADVLLGRDFELLPPDAKAARKEEVIKAISGLTASDADALSSAVPVEERKGFNIGEAYDNLVALRNATADFADATGMDVSPSVMNAAEAAVALQDATEDTADLDVKLNDAVAAMLMAGLNGRPMMRVGNMTLRVREVKGEADNSPATFRAEIQFLKPDTAKADRRRTPDANGVLVLGEADTYDKAVAIISTDAELRDDIRTRLAEATEATKAWRNAVNAGLYTALHGDAAMLANGDNITIRNEGGEINLRATAPLYRNLLKAVIMQQAGKTAEEVYTETMWIGDGNGNWTMALPRFELSDEDANKFANGTPVTLGEIVGKNYPLFRIHPEMAALTVPVLDGDAADTVSGVPPRDAAAVREHAAGALRGDAKSRGMLAAMVYASVADVLERREGLQDGAIPRMMPNDDAITGEHLRDIVLRDGANGIFNQQEIDRRLIRSFAIPQEHQGNPAEYVLRLANGAGGIDALLEKGIETNAAPPELQGLTTFSEKGGLVNDYSTLITLLKGADASTMPHELGHWMLRVLRQFVKSGVASRQLMDAVAAIDAHLDNYARSKGAIEGTNEWESVRHEAFSESFVKYLMTADADELTQGAFSQLRRQLLNTYKWMRSNSTIEPAASLNELFDSLVAAGEMFDRGEAPLSAFDADTFRAIFAEAGLLDSSNEAIGKFLDLLGIARDAQETLAGREAVNSIDREKLTAEARQKYADSSFAKLAAALNRLGGFPVEALIEALPDTVPGEKREELRRVLHETARRQGWAFHARTAEALMREARRGEEDAKAAVKAQTTRIAEMEQQLSALENHAREVAGRPAAIRQEIDSIMADVNAIAKKIEDLQSRHFPDAQRLTELQSQLDINKKRNKPTAKLREEIDTLQKRMARFVSKREELYSARRRLNDKAMKASGRLERVNASNAVAEAQADVAQKKADIEIARGRLAELQDALQVARENAIAARARTEGRDVTYSITDFSSQAAEDLRSLEISDQMRALRAAMDSGELPARSFAELVDAIASFRTEADFVKEYKAAAMRDAFNHPDMTMRMKTLDSAKLNAMFEQLALVLKQFAPNYTYSQRRQINVSRALQLIGGSTVNAIMHNRLDAEGLDGDVRLFGSIKAEANNIVMALSKIAKRAGELRKDGEPTTESLKVKARDAQLALESLNRINQFVAVARRINRAQAMVTNFVKELRVSSLGKQRGRIDGDALNALREILLAVTHNQNVPIDANSQRNSVGNWRKRYVSEMDAAAVESGMEPRQWGEVCFRDDIDLQSLTIDEAQELSEFFKFIKHTGRALVDQTRLDNKEHRRSTIRQIVAELTPDAERNNHHAMPATEERDAGLWELLKSVCRSWDARSTSVWRYMTEHGEALNGIYRLLTEMKTREDSLRALVYDGNGADGLNTILQDIERIASEQGVDVSSLDNSPVAFTGNDDTHSYRHWTLHEVIMATLYLGTDSGRQRLRRTINTDSAMREADLVEKYPDAVLEQIPAALPPVILEKVNGIWAALERLNASVRDTYRKQYGYELDLLDPVPFSVNGVQMTGGYAPIAYRYSAAAYKPGLQDKVGEGKGTDMDLFERGRAYTPQTQAVHKRLGILFGHPPLALTMKTLLRYTEEASHYASHALGMGYILKVMRSKEVKNVFERAYGVEAYRALEATLLQVSAPDKYLERATTAEKYLKSTVVAAALWGNASSVLKQTASITVGASEVGLGNLLSAMGDFLAHPREMVAKVREASPYMRNRVNKLDDNIANTLEQLFATGSERILNRVQWLGYAPIGYFDMVVAGIGFTAAFRKAISEGRTPMEAKAYAEDFVKRTQGSAETLYNPQIKNTFFGRSMTMFMTAAIAQYNFLRHDMAMASKRGIASTVSAVAFDMVVPALICAAITMALTPGGGGDDDDTELEKRIARGRDEFLANLWGGIPMANFVGDAWLTMAASDFSGGRMNRMEYLSPLADAVGSLGRAGKLAYNGQLLAAAINLGNAISIPANMPVIKVAERLAKYAKALHLTDPDEKPWTLREFTREAEKETR